MSYDVKNHRFHQPRPNARGGTLLGIFLGLVVGVAIAGVVVWFMRSSPSPFVDKQASVAKAPPPADVPPVAPPSPPAPAGQPLPLPGKPGDPPPEQRFQFYDILAGKKEAVPDPKALPPKDNKQPPQSGMNPAPVPGPEADKQHKIFLQTGAFSKASEAENQKARLALQGIEASVQQVVVDDKTLFRVRMGPFSRMEDVSRIRSELAISGIEASLVKNKE